VHPLKVLFRIVATADALYNGALARRHFMPPGARDTSKSDRLAYGVTLKIAVASPISRVSASAGGLSL
jgi:hypothetical protein